MTTPELAVEAVGLRKRYQRGKQAVTALDGFDLAVPAGTVCGLLGPNGAGKTTAVRILATLLRFDAGRARVAGYDLAGQSELIRFRIGLTAQNPAVDEILTGRQNLEMFGRLYHLGARHANRRAGELLDRFGLAEAAGRQVKKYSGGMRRRLDLAVSFLLAPRVLFLDEPTNGLDPRHRNEIWEMIRQLAAEGTTVLLTTHYLDEADQLADHISVIDRGTVIANGTPEQLKSRIGGDRLELVLPEGTDLTTAAAVVARCTGAEPRTEPATRRISTPVEHRVATLTEVIRALDEAGLPAEDIALRRPTLDDVFLRLTGRPTSEAPEAQAAPRPREEVTVA